MPYCRAVERSIFLVGLSWELVWGTLRVSWGWSSGEELGLRERREMDEGSSAGGGSMGLFGVGSHRLGRAILASSVSKGK